MHTYRRIRKERDLGTKMVDVDGSYLHRKAVSTGIFDDRIPDIPLAGWESVDCLSSNTVNKIPIISHGKLYFFVVCD